MRQEYNKNPIYRVLYLFIGFYRFVRTLGNFVAGLIGGNVNIKNIDQLPNIFGQCMWMLFVVALLLFIAKKPS
ncbi:Di-/tripeptide transporter [Campylobacter jejuni]